MIAVYIGVIVFCTSTLIATIVINRRAQQALTRLRHPTANSLIANIIHEDMTASLVINGNTVARFLPVALPAGGGLELGFYATEAEDGRVFLYSIEATSMTGPPEDGSDNYIGI